MRLPCKGSNPLQSFVLTGSEDSPVVSKELAQIHLAVGNFNSRFSFHIFLRPTFRNLTRSTSVIWPPCWWIAAQTGCRFSVGGKLLCQRWESSKGSSFWTVDLRAKEEELDGWGAMEAQGFKLRTLWLPQNNIKQLQASFRCYMLQSGCNR